MAFINRDELDKAKQHTRYGTSNATCRDRARLMSLRERGFAVISCNDNQSEKQCEPESHVQCKFNERGARTVAHFLTRPPDYVFLVSSCNLWASRTCV